MALLEFLMKPLLDAQLEAGIEIGRKEGREEEKKEFETWKSRQRAAGAVFLDDDDLPEDPPERTEPPDADA